LTRVDETKPPLGRLLVERGVLTLEHLEEAPTEKETSGARLGEILVRRGWLTAADVARALAEQHELEFMELAGAEGDPGAASLLPEKFARRYGALPIRFVGDEQVVVAIADPTNVLNSDDLRLALGLNVRLVVVPGPDLEKTIASTAPSSTSPSPSSRKRWPTRKCRSPTSATALQPARLGSGSSTS